MGHRGTRQVNIIYILNCTIVIFYTLRFKKTELISTLVNNLILNSTVLCGRVGKANLLLDLS